MRLLIYACAVLAVLTGKGQANQRELGTVWTTYSTSSRRCKTECLDQGYFYCSKDLQGTSGICCDSEKNCPRPKGALCSFDTIEGAMGLAYWTCPRDAAMCGPQETITVAGSIREPDVLSLGAS